MTFKPVVIPQVTKSFGSEIASPFLRSYSPSLQHLNLSRNEFLAFLDGLNEAFIANPVLQATSLAGSVIGMIHPVELVGMGIEVASEVGSGVTSYFRTKAYLEKANREVFYSRGLVAEIVDFDKMCRVVGVEREWLKVAMGARIKEMPSDKESEGETGTLKHISSGSLEGLREAEWHPQLKMLQVLGEYVAPLELENKNSPVSSDQKNMLKRFNASLAAREGQKQNKKLEKKYRKAKERREEKQQESLRERHEYDKKITELEEKIQKLQQDSEKDDKDKDKKICRLKEKIDKVRRDQEEEMNEQTGRDDKKLQRAQHKEVDKTMKMKWLVIYSVETQF
ncbi:hypothetical protein BJX70DRAFT_386378 [Aspergillus crustosus]